MVLVAYTKNDARVRRIVAELESAGQQVVERQVKMPLPGGQDPDFLPPGCDVYELKFEDHQGAKESSTDVMEFPLDGPEITFGQVVFVHPMGLPFYQGEVGGNCVSAQDLVLWIP